MIIKQKTMTYREANALAHQRAQRHPEHAYLVIRDPDDFDEQTYRVISYEDYLYFPCAEHQVVNVVEFCDGQFYYD